MEKYSIIEEKKDARVEKPRFFENKDVNNEAFDFVEKNRDFFEHYSKGNIKVEPSPDNLNTFAFNLKDNTIYVNPMFYKEAGFSDEKTIFATLHEVEHFSEKIQVLKEKNGEKSFKNYLEKNKKSKAFALMDNCIADIRENRSVISRTNEGMKEIEDKMYKENLFKDIDFTSQPRHIQLCEALLREARVKDEKCTIAEEVRQKIEAIEKVDGLMDIMTNPETPMSLRWKLQDKYIWPKLQDLLEKDIEDKKNKKEENKDQENSGNGGQSEESDQDEKERGDEKDSQKSEGQDEEKKEEGNENEEEGKGKSKKSEDKKQTEKKGKGGDREEEKDPNKIFEKEYDEAQKNFPEAVPIEDIEKAFEEWKKDKENSKESKDKADEDYAEKIGVTKESLQNYRKVAEHVRNIVNENTGVEVLEEMKNLFSRIISKRTKKVFAPKYPTEEGDYLVDPSQLVAEVKSGNLEPRVWEDIELKEKKGDRFGEVEITLVCDRSGSMEGEKAEEQRKSTILVMETLKEFAEMTEEDKMNMDKPLEIKSEIYSFACESDDKKPIKIMSKDLGEAERINVLDKLYNITGSTTDFSCLESIEDKLDTEIEKKIEEGELKKIVIVMTDGESDDPSRVQSILKVLRGKGVVVIGLGITNSGGAVMSTYSPNALVVENVKNLPFVLTELLKEHLKDI